MGGGGECDAECRAAETRPKQQPAASSARPITTESANDNTDTTTPPTTPTPTPTTTHPTPPPNPTNPDALVLDDRDLLAVVAGQDAVDQRRLAGAEEAGDDRDRDLGGCAVGARAGGG